MTFRRYAEQWRKAQVAVDVLAAHLAAFPPEWRVMVCRDGNRSWVETVALQEMLDGDLIADGWASAAVHDALDPGVHDRDRRVHSAVVVVAPLAQSGG